MGQFGRQDGSASAALDAVDAELLLDCAGAPELRAEAARAMEAAVQGGALPLAVVRARHPEAPCG